MSVLSRLANVFRSARVGRELDEELQFHLEERSRALEAAGLSPEAAARQAARRLGNPLRLREQSLDVKLLPWLDALARDVRLGIRLLRRNALVAGAAIVSLALALGACVAAFTMVDALILRPLPVRDPEQLVYLTTGTDNPDRPESDTFSDPLFVRLRDASRSQVELFAMSTQVMRGVTLPDAGGEKEMLRTQYVSGDAFERLGVGPLLGRVLAGQQDEHPDASPVAVVSHAFWTRRFGRDPSVIGRWFGMDGRQFQIVGVSEPGFAGIEPGRDTDVWLPYRTYNPRAFGNPQFGWFRIVGRLKAKGGAEQAQSVLRTTFAAYQRDLVATLGRGRSPEANARFLTTPMFVRSAANGPSPLRAQFGRALWLLTGIAALVLIIAGSNVANLFLARTAARTREMALRLSIGAGRGRLIQQVLVESALVSIGACLLGLLVAAAAAPAVVNLLASADDPVRLDLRVGWRVIALAGGLATLTTALFGLIPALRASRVAPLSALKTGGARSSGLAGAMRPFVAAQVAFGLMVLFVGSLLVQSFTRLSNVNPGFSAAKVLLISLEAVPPIDPLAQRAALYRVMGRLAELPEVQAISAAESNVFGRAWTYNVRMPGSEFDRVEATMLPVTPGFLETMRIPVLAGRDFARGDVDTAKPTAIVVNEAFAARYFGQGPAIGRTVAARFGSEDDSDQHEVIGVAADTKYDLRKPAAPAIYLPMRLRSNGTIHVRVSGDPVAAAARLREVIRGERPPFRVTTTSTQSVMIERTLLRERMLALLAGFFAVIGVVLAAVGLYGILSYAVVQRTREIGIRMALGAQRSGVVLAVLSESGMTVLAGMVCGLAGGLYLSRFIEALLFEVTPLAFWSLTLPLATLLLSALLAAALPALRATRVDPVIALRDE